MLISTDSTRGSDARPADRPTHSGRSRLRQALVKYFNEDDLRTLCFDLDVEYDTLAGQGTGGKARELLGRCEREARTAELIAACRKVRPKAPWDDLLSEQEREAGRPAPAAADLAPLRERYLREVWDACVNLKLTTIDIKTATGGREAAELELDAVFTDLDVKDAGRREEMAAFQDASRKRSGRSETEPGADRLPAMAALVRHPRLVLLGDPGSGKSTLVNFVALCLAGDGLGSPVVNRRRLGESWTLPGLLPVRVILRDYAARGLPADKGVWPFIQNELAATGESLAACIPAVQQALEARDAALLLLDGVDEVPEAGRCRVRLKEKIEQFGRSFPHCRVLVTSRPYAYQDPEAWLVSFQVRPLADFSPEQVQTFIGRWYAHMGQRDHALGPAVAERYARQLQAAVKQNPRLAELAPRPLLLTLMASLHRWREGGSLPEKRQELYEASVGLLLDLWQRPKQVFDSQGRLAGIEYDVWKELGIGAEALREALNLIAYEAHWRQPGQEGTHDIRARDLVGVLYERSDKAKTGADADRGERRIVAYLTDRAGLLVERKQGEVYSFPHRTFQEYLAACHLADEDFPFLLAERLREDDGRWREASLLAAARAVSGSKSAIWNLVAGFCPTDVGQNAILPYTAPDWYAALRAAEALIETEQHLNVPPRQRPLVDRLRGWLVALVEAGRLPPRDRAAAGRTLARLSDPRRGVGLMPDGLPDIAWCDVPAGEFLMGESADQHRESIPASFQISRYPITNTQFDAFVQDGGYTAKWRRCWTAAGWEWKGDSTGPYKFGGAYDLPNHPVVAVTWYEAVAFCRWLGEKLGCQVALPTEAQWEKAARGGLPSPSQGEGSGVRVYPWGDAITPDHANYDETGIGTTTAVGIFPKGKSPCDALDMAGNVWEWCLTKWRDNYRTAADDDPEGDALRVQRGGAYWNNSDVVRCAFRDRIGPVRRGGYGGFRVARSSP